MQSPGYGDGEFERFVATFRGAVSTPARTAGSAQLWLGRLT
jgi:hypothetical protein